jgi:thiol-disulfide isomerase/thioredoxin
MHPDASRRHFAPSRATLATAVAIALTGLGAVYAKARSPDNGGGPHPKAMTEAVLVAEAPAGTPSEPGSGALNVGEMARFVFKKAPEPLPEVKFVDDSGKERTLKDWHGRTVLLNVWATWCIPCRKEMPSLEKLQAALGSKAFEVVAISADRGGIDAAKKFLDQIKVSKLGLYADPTVRLAANLKVVGMPATLLVDGEGREIGRLLGPAEWDTEDARTLIRSTIK